MIGSSPRRRGTLVPIDHRSHLERFIPAQAGNTRRGAPAARTFPVHPRAGGEHRPTFLCSTIGSSPRRRGTQPDVRLGNHRPRFIPAQAGNTFDSPVMRPQPPVHPRAGGEHASRTTRFGSSPRRRGTRNRDARDPRSPVHPRAGGEHPSEDDGGICRFIPAQAGNTGSDRRPSLDHRFIPAQAGNTPLPSARAASGSSPRRRGTPPFIVLALRFRRFIPAQAGNTDAPSSRAPSVHPRAGGEHAKGTQVKLCDAGSSPRRRGTQRIDHRETNSTGSSRRRGTQRWARASAPGNRFIPAQAGNTTEALQRSSRGGSSPRRRGTRLRSHRHIAEWRFIPAQAGNTSSEHPWERTLPVHPRAGGEHILYAPFGSPVTVHPRAGGEHRGSTWKLHVYIGSSPRRRGTQRNRSRFLHRGRFIPAQAGNTIREAPHLQRRENGSSPRRRGTL